MSIAKEKNIALPDKKTNIYIIWDETGHYFKGKSRCHDDELDMYSPILGGEIAHLRALQKYLKSELKKLKKMPLSEEDFRKKEEKMRAELNNIPITIGELVARHIKSKELVKAFKERKAKGIGTWQEQYEQQMNNLKNYIKKVKSEQK